MSTQAVKKMFLPGGKGVGVSARTGAGKSTIFYFSKYVTKILLVDSGSGGHHFNKQATTEVAELNMADPERSPVQQSIAITEKWTKAGHLWLLDSFTTMQEQMCAWWKRHRCKGGLTLQQHGFIVGEMRDLALCLAGQPGFTLFNTSPGGQIRTPEGQVINIPMGVLVGYPALSGLKENAESILARFTSSWILFPGFKKVNKDTGLVERTIPRGLLLPDHDIRGGNIANYAPIKDPMRILRGTPIAQTPEEIADGTPQRISELDLMGPMPDKASDPAIIDGLLDRIYERYHIAPAAPAGEPLPEQAQATADQEAPPARGRRAVALRAGPGAASRLPTAGSSTGRSAAAGSSS